MNIQAHQIATSCAILLGLVYAASADERIVQISGPTMGTVYHIKVVGARETTLLQGQVDKRLNEINALMSTYVADSEVSRFNRSPAGHWFPVSRETLDVVDLAKGISQDTGGAFDITVGPLVRLWNFGAQAKPGMFSPPNEDDIQETLKLVGHRKLKTRQDPPALRKSVRGLQIDLSAIAKGYAVDQIAELLLARNNVDFMVEIGGEVRVMGSRPDGNAWRIGVEAPDADARRVQTVLQPRDRALASSGDYRNYHEHYGTRYSHTIDPRTGRPVNHDLAAVSVMSADCTTADALATALLVLGPTEGKAWAEKHQVAALLMSRTDGGIQQVRTSHLDASSVADPQVDPPSGLAKTLLLSAAVFGIAVLAMSVGVLFGRRRIQGSCGGLAGLQDEHGKTLCEACTNPSPTCQGNPSVSDT